MEGDRERARERERERNGRQRESERERERERERARKGIPGSGLGSIVRKQSRWLHGWMGSRAGGVVRRDFFKNVWIFFCGG
jgi:hypothetical protein